ncbi:hypothetical protein N7470_007867 [Penicillium chermesinum]|nr:hypothetical protein N7470_007867 [Penicillium chermesinum]
MFGSKVFKKDDEAVIDRCIPKSVSKQHAKGVARLYVAYPDPMKWTYTGLQGAVVLCEDTTVPSLWLKMVDISPARRGVIWDQEIYEDFHYTMQRSFFYTFDLQTVNLQECHAGLLFADEDQAKKFDKTMQTREKHISKKTSEVAFQKRNPDFNPEEPVWQNLIRELLPLVYTMDAITVLVDSLFRLGLKKRDIAGDPVFIKEYIQQNNMSIGGPQAPAAQAPPRPVAPAPAPITPVETPTARTPPPPPPSAPPAPKANNISPQVTGSSNGSRRGPPPPPPSRKARADAPEEPAAPSPAPVESPPARRFNAPPPLPDAGKYAEPVGPAGPRRRAVSNVGNGAPAAPPPLPPKAPMDGSQPKFGVPPPFTGNENHLDPLLHRVAALYLPVRLPRLLAQMRRPNCLHYLPKSPMLARLLLPLHHLHLHRPEHLYLPPPPLARFPSSGTGTLSPCGTSSPTKRTCFA